MANSISLVHNAVDALRLLKQHAKMLVLLSGGLDIHCEAIVKKIDEYAPGEQLISQFITNTFVSDSNGLVQTVRCSVGDDEGNDKKWHIEAFCRERGINPADCLGIGDGFNDASMFAAVGTPIAFLGYSRADEARLLRDFFAQRPQNVVPERDLLAAAQRAIAIRQAQLASGTLCVCGAGFGRFSPVVGVTAGPAVTATAATTPTPPPATSG
eukprot:GAFH01004034.1.p3 GENE.GAFH01004034.1~~GAFH01004034.1.p3  ORF type:complete len:242 (+),score=36.97 GAFH01004034.1:93-728(+)